MSEQKIDDLRTTEELYAWMEQNMSYGWIGVDGTEHINEMKNFRKDYRTMSIEEIRKRKMGTCIEQVAFMHNVLDHMGIQNTMYWRRT